MNDSLKDTVIYQWIKHISQHVPNKKIKNMSKILEVLTYVHGMSDINESFNNNIINMTLKLCIDIEVYKLNATDCIQQFINALDDSNLENNLYIITTLYNGTEPYARYELWKVVEKALRLIPCQSITHMALLIELLEINAKKNGNNPN